MKRIWLPVFMLMLAGPFVSAVEPVDLAKIDRSIAKEPKYSAASQEYCLLVFGPKAETRVWLVRDGDVLYVDRNGNGDLTEAGEAFAAPHRENPRWDHLGEIALRDGKTKYLDLEVHRLAQGYRVTLQLGPDRYQSAGAMQADKPVFAAEAKDAPIIHFDGPLALAQYSTKRVIPRDEKGSSRARSLRVMVGTPGLGAGTFAAHDCCLCDKLGPLVAKFEFSPPSPHSAPAPSAQGPAAHAPAPRGRPPIETSQTFQYDD